MAVRDLCSGRQGRCRGVGEVRRRWERMVDLDVYVIVSCAALRQTSDPADRRQKQTTHGGF